MNAFTKSPLAPLCGISRQALAMRINRDRAKAEAAVEAAAADVRDQLRFEAICARELLGEID